VIPQRILRREFLARVDLPFPASVPAARIPL